MDETFAKLRNRFPTFPQDLLRIIYKCRLERLKVLTRFGLPEDLRWVIEGKVRLTGEFHDSFERYMAGMGKSSYAKKRRAKRMGVCHKCARWTCNKRCRNPGMVSINREDKIQFIKDGLSKESRDDIRQTLETHPSGNVGCLILDLVDLFQKEKQRCCLGDLTLKDPVCQFIRKLDGKQILDS